MRLVAFYLFCAAGNVGVLFYAESSTALGRGLYLMAVIGLLMSLIFAADYYLEERR